MKEKILNLRNDGKTYKEIQDILKCSKSTISYHCGEGQKEKTKNRTKQIRENNPLIQKVSNFKGRIQKQYVLSSNGDREKRYFIEMSRKFQKRNCDGYDKNGLITFNWKDVMLLFGDNPICYLSGEKLDYSKNNYSFDHITPVSKGGDNTIKNLGITHRIVNQMKSDLTVDELIEWCVKVLEYNNYSVIKNLL
jgi:5-methylcytosine-specific restriction endonuclease McrA